MSCFGGVEVCCVIIKQQQQAASDDIHNTTYRVVDAQTTHDIRRLTFVARVNYTTTTDSRVAIEAYTELNSAAMPCIIIF
jgi:hypothetical protein